MSPEENHFDLDRKVRIKWPPEADEYIIMPKREFHQLRERVEADLESCHESFTSAYYALFGASLSIGVTVPPLFAAKGLASWVIPTYIVSACALFVLGLVLALLVHTLRARQDGAASKLARDMHVMEEIYGGKGAATRSEPKKTR
jgi:hypothetical protein